MALNTRGSIDPRWLTHNRAVEYGLMLASVEVYRSSTDVDSYDASTNTWSGTSTELYTGRARVQTTSGVTSSSGTTDTYDPTLFQTVKIVIPYNKNEITGSGEIPDIRPNDKVKITASAYNETLTKFIFVVESVLNSSNAWERTLVCKVDIELDPTNTSGV